MTAGRRVEWRLSAVELDVLWREFGRGLPPYPLELPSPGATYGERAEVVAQIWAQLAARGVVEHGPQRRLPPDIDDALEVLHNGRVVIDGILDFGEQVGLLAARDGVRAAMALQRGDDVRLLATMDAALLSGRLVELLPDVDRYDFTPQVANGFAVGLFARDLFPTLLVFLGYLLPWALLSFYLMRAREIAGAH